MSNILEAARERVRNAETALRSAADQITNAPADAPAEVVEQLHRQFDDAEAAHRTARENAARMEKVMEARSVSPNLLSGDDGTHERRDFTYSRSGGNSFFADVARASRGDYEAARRLQRHGEEMREVRDISDATPAGGGGFVPPAWMGNLWADVPRPGRPFAEAVPQYEAPASGETVTLPRLKTGATADVQAAQLDAVSETDVTTDTVTASIVSIAGQQDVSLQLLTQTAAPGLDMVLFQDLTSALDSKLDTQLLSGSGGSGQHLGIRAVTGVETVDGSGFSSGADFLVGVDRAISKIASNRYRTPNAIVMHPRRAAFLASERSTDYPLLQQSNLVFASGRQDGGQVASIQGLRVIIDANVGTTYGASTSADEAYVVYLDDLALFETPVAQNRFDAVLSGNLAVRLQVYSFSWFIAGRYPSGICVIQNLAAPSGF